MTRCTDPTCDDGPPLDSNPAPRFTVDGLLLCRRCASALERRLAELPSQHDALRSVLGGLRASERAENRPTKGTPPVPLNIAAHDHLEAMQAVLVSWVRMTCEERDLRGPDRSTVAILSRWLLSQLPWLLGHGAVGDLAAEILDLAHVADGLTQANPRRYRLDAPCPLLGCGERQLTREDGAGEVWCDSCGGIWTEDQYPWMVRVALDATSGCLTAQEAADRLGVTVGHIRNLVTAGLVRKLGTVDGTARYSTRDVEELRKEEAS